MKTVRKLDDDILIGDASAQELSQQYATTVMAIENHIDQCVDDVTGMSGYDKLSRMLVDINRAAAERQRTYKSNANNAEAMDHYIDLIKEARSTIVAMERLRPSDELVKEITKKILRPLVVQCITITVEESKKLKDDIRTYSDPAALSKLDRSVEQYLRRIAPRLNKNTVDLIPKLEKLLNVTESVIIDEKELDESDIPEDGEGRFYRVAENVDSNPEPN